MRIFLLLCFLLMCFRASAQQQNRVSDSPKEFILLFDDITEISTAFRFSTGLLSVDENVLVRLDEPLKLATGQKLTRYLWQDDSGITPTLEEIQQLTGAAIVEPNYFYKLDLENWNDAAADSQWYLDVIQLREAHQITQGSADVIVALIDTGVDFEHEDLQDIYYLNTREQKNGIDDDGNGYPDDIRGWNFVDDTPDASDTQGHGTAMAGIIAANTNNNIGIVGIAPETKIMPLKAFDESGRGSLFNVIRAILYATDMAADIVNMSFGFAQESRLERLAMEHAESRGVTLITSAGNVGGPNKRFPAALDEVIAVSWTGQNDRIGSLASYGPHVALAAPGSSIYTANFTPGVTNAGYRFVNGSSASAAVVSGVAALLKAKEPNLTPKQIRSKLQISADDVMDDGWDNYTGAGRVNAHRALGVTTFAKARIDSLSFNEEIFKLDIYGSAYHPMLDYYQIRIAEGLRDNLDFLTMKTGTKNKINSVIETIFVVQLPELSATYHTLSLLVVAKSGEKLEYRKHFFPTQNEPELYNDFALPGLSGDRNIIASQWISDYPVVGEAVLHSVEVEEKNLTEKSATRHLFEYPVYSDTDFQETFRAKHPELPFKTVGHQTFEIEPVALQFDFFRRQKLQEYSNRLFGFHDNKWPELDDIVILSQQNQDKPQLVYYRYDGQELVKLGALEDFGIPRSVGDFTGDGQPEMLLQFSNQMLILSTSADGIYPTEVISGDEPLQGWGITFADVDGDGELQAWAFEGEQLFYYTWNNGNPQRHETEIRIPNMSTPVGVVADIRGNGRDELIIGNNNRLFMVGYEDGAYQILSVIETEASGANRGFEVIEHEGHWYLFSSTESLRGQDSFAITFPQYQLVSLYKFDQEKFIKTDRILISGAAVSVRDMQVLHRNNEQMAVYTNYTQLYVFGVDEDKITLRHYDEGLSVINTAVLGGQIIATGTADNSLLFTGDAGEQTAIVWMRAPTSADSLEVFASFRGSAELIETEYVETGEVIQQQLDTRTGERYKLAEFERVDGSDEHTIEIRLIQNNEVLASRRQVFGISQEFKIESVRVNRNTITVKTSAPIVPAYISLDNFIDDVFTRNPTGKVEFVDMLVHSPVKISFVLKESIHSINYAHFPILRNADYAQAKNAYQEYRLMNINPERRELYISDYEILNEKHIRIFFNEGVNVPNKNLVDLQPRGSVVSVERYGHNSLNVRVSNTVLKGSGITHTLIFRDVPHPEYRLNTEFGNRIEIVDQPESLNDVRAYPNPWNTNETSELTFANLMVGAIVRVYSVDGRMVRQLYVDTFSGGVFWDGTTASGQSVGSGVYLYQVHFDDKVSDIKKVVIVR